MSISAKIVADSISPDGVRLVTMELNYHRFIHSEFMTHRVFSRNASSSRAIPVEKMIAAVRSSPAMPIHWGKNQPGMQAREELPRQWVLHPHNGEKEQFEGYWKSSAISAARCAEGLAEIGMHKQIVNRLTEPFQWIKVLVTATEWDNFFKLRHHEDAQPEIAQLALRMKEAMEGSIPVELQPGEWHLPYVDCRRKDQIDDLEASIKCSVARCARVSYLNHDNSNSDIDKDIALADMLLNAGHMSPFEHQATPIPDVVYKDETDFDLNYIEGITHIDRNRNYWSGNFRGWIQHRQTL